MGGDLDVFVSYTGADAVWAEWIAWELQQAGQRVLLQKWHMVPGTHWDLEMDEGLRRAARIVAVFSPAYRDSFYAMKEALAGLRREKRGRSRQLVPVRVRECEWTSLLGGIVGIDLVGVDEEVARERLLTGYRAAVTGSAEPDHAPPFPSPPAAPAVPERPDFPGVLPAVFNVRRANDRFTGREALLRELHEKLTAAGRVTVASVRGLGGIGKTETAVEYAHRHAHELDTVWWVDAEATATIPGQLAALAGALGVPVEVADAARARDELARRDRWLLIFDNAEDPASVEEWLPAGGRGRVLVTTRQSGFQSLGPVLEVPVWERAESVAFLTARCPGITPGDADRLAEVLGDLALALEQAAAYLDTEQMAVGRYLELRASASGSLLGKGRVLGHRETVATVWSMSVKRVAAANPAALELLRACSLLAAEPIPLDVFTAVPEVWPAALAAAARDPLAFEEAVGALARYALVSRGPDSVVLHRLVQATTANGMPDEARATIRTALLAALRRVAPTRVQNDPESWVWWRSWLPHVLEVAPTALGTTAPPRRRRSMIDRLRGRPGTAKDGSSDASLLLDLAGGYLRTMGQPEQAVPLLEAARAEDEKRLGADHPDALASQGNLAGAYRAVGRYGEAIHLYEQNLTDHRRILGPHHPNTLTSRNNLAETYSAAGRHTDAIHHHEQNLSDRQRILGPHHPDTLLSRNNLAEAYSDAGRHTDAIHHHEHNLADCERVLGPDHPTTEAVRRNLAITRAAADQNER